MKRVLIVGCPGAGKSTLAKELAEATRLPVVHLDRHYWQPGWQRPDSASWQKTVEKLAAQSEWIMDGNYSGTLEQRLASADTLIHLDYTTSLCLWRVIRRTVSGLGRNRGCRGGWLCLLRDRRAYRAGRHVLAPVCPRWAGVTRRKRELT